MANMVIQEPIVYAVQGDNASTTVTIPLNFSPTSVTFVQALNNLVDVSSNVASVFLKGMSVVVTFAAAFDYSVAIFLTFITNLPGASFAVDSGVLAVPVNKRSPVLSIQVSANFNSAVNRVQTLLNTLMFVVGEGTARWELVLNGTLTGAIFAPVNASSSVNKDTSATSITGGTVIMSGYGVADNGGVSGTGGIGGNAPRGHIEQELSKLSALTNSYDGTTGDILSIVVSSFVGTTKISSSITWNELQ